MSLLLDTLALYWWLNDEPRLGGPARAVILASPKVVVSTVSIWEFAV